MSHVPRGERVGEASCDQVPGGEQATGAASEPVFSLYTNDMII